MITLNRFALLAAALLCMVLAPATRAATNDAAKVRAGTQAWINAHNASDVEAIVQIYAVDAISMPPGSPPAHGHSAIRQFFSKDMAEAREAGVTLALTGADDVTVKGNVAWHAGSYAVKTRAGTTIDTGGYIEVWRRAAGQWHIVRDVWNSSSPPMPATLAPLPKP